MRKPKFSRELLDLRKIEVSLAKQGEYAEAQKVKEQADAMEATEKSQRLESLAEVLRLSEQHVRSKPQLLAGQTPGACRLACSSPMSWQRARDAL